MAPTRAGTRNPGMVATMLVTAIRVPAKLEAMSVWLENTPENMDPKAATVQQVEEVILQPAGLWFDHQPRHRTLDKTLNKSICVTRSDWETHCKHCFVEPHQG